MVKKALLKEFCDSFPEYKDKIDYVDVGTPLTNEHYYGRYSSYGLAFTNERFLDKKIFMYA